MKTILFFCAALIINSCTYLDAGSIKRKLPPGPTFKDDCEYWLYDTKHQRIRCLNYDSYWFPASNLVNYPREVNPFSYHNIAFSYGTIAQMSYTNNTDNGVCFRLKFLNSAIQPSNIELGFWDFSSGSFTTYLSEVGEFIDCDTDCCWNNDFSYYFFRQENQFTDISKFLKYRRIVCFKISYLQ